MDGVVNNLKHKQSYRGTSSLRKNSSGSSNRVVRGASYLAKGADNISTNLAKKLRPTEKSILIK
jgi:hypothetical protein